MFAPPRWLRRPAACAALVLAGATAPAPLRAGDAPPQAAAVRELSTDRPDATESPFTVDVGHLQLELDAARFTHNRLDGVKTTEWTVAPFNLRYGLAPNFEAGIFFVPHVRVTEQFRGGPKTVTRGVGDTTLRVKLNLQGNDGGPQAFGVLADLKLPTAAGGLGNDRVEGALTFPVAYELSAGWEGGAMTSVELAQTERGRRAVWVNTVTFGHDLVENVSGYLELTSAAGDGAHVASFNCGLTRKVNANLQLDAGVLLGLSRTAPDLTVFAGVSQRF